LSSRQALFGGRIPGPGPARQPAPVGSLSRVERGIGRGAGETMRVSLTSDWSPWPSPPACPGRGWLGGGRYVPSALLDQHGLDSYQANIKKTQPRWRIAAVSFFLVDPERFELSAFSMPLRRAPNCAMGPARANSNRKEARRQHSHSTRRNRALNHAAAIYDRGCNCGPGGIRTLGLFSAIEARSQLRYRPSSKSGILPRCFCMCQATG
jgi:hypothetical protein